MCTDGNQQYVRRGCTNVDQRSAEVPNFDHVRICTHGPYRLVATELGTDNRIVRLNHTHRSVTYRDVRFFASARALTMRAFPPLNAVTPTINAVLFTSSMLAAATNVDTSQQRREGSAQSSGNFGRCKHFQHFQRSPWCACAMCWYLLQFVVRSVLPVVNSSIWLRGRQKWLAQALALEEAED
jgi:hypothetical protein